MWHWLTSDRHMKQELNIIVVCSSWHHTNRINAYTSMSQYVGEQRGKDLLASGNCNITCCLICVRVVSVSSYFGPNPFFQKGISGSDLVVHFPQKHSVVTVCEVQI